MCFSTSRKVAPRVDTGFAPPRLWITSGLATILELASSCRYAQKEIAVAGFRRWCHKMKLSFFHEPELGFGNGGAHVDIRF